MRVGERRHREPGLVVAILVQRVQQTNDLIGKTGVAVNACVGFGRAMRVGADPAVETIFIQLVR